MDYSKIKDYIDYDRYITASDDTNLDTEKRYMRMVDDLRWYKSKIEKKWAECKNPNGCQCREPQRHGDSYDSTNQLIEVLERAVRRNLEDIAEYNPELLSKELIAALKN